MCFFPCFSPPHFSGETNKKNLRLYSTLRRRKKYLLGCFALIGQICRRYTVGLDVDKLGFTGKSFLYAENSCIDSPLILIAKEQSIYLKDNQQETLVLAIKATAATKNTYIA